MPAVKLTNTLVQNTNAVDKAIELRDTEVRGLICRIRATGRKVFELVYKKNGVRRSNKLGVWPHMTVKMAQEKAKIELGEATKKQAFPERNVGKKVLRAFAVEYFSNTSLRTKKETERVLNVNWAELLDKPLREISRAQIDKVRSEMTRNGAAPASVNRMSTVLRSILSNAVALGELHDHPMKGIKPLHVSNDARVRTLSNAERGRLYGIIDAADCDPAVGTGIYMLLNTGARMGELRGLHTDYLDIKNLIITIRATTSKVAKSRNIPINKTLAERLTIHNSWTAPSRKQWGTMMRRARIENFTPHHCRHDFLSRLANSGVPMHIVSAIAVTHQSC